MLGHNSSVGNRSVSNWTRIIALYSCKCPVTTVRWGHAMTCGELETVLIWQVWLSSKCPVTTVSNWTVWLTSNFLCDPGRGPRRFSCCRIFGVPNSFINKPHCWFGPTLCIKNGHISLPNPPSDFRRYGWLCHAHGYSGLVKKNSLSKSRKKMSLEIM